MTKKQWLEKNSYKSQLLSNSIIPMNPDIGFYIKVNDIEIPEKYFKNQYKKISSAYFSILKEMDQYWKNQKVNKK